MKGKTHKLAHRLYHTAIVLEGNSGVILTRKDGNPHRYVQGIAEAEAIAGKLIDYHADRARLSDDEWNQIVEFPATQMAKIREVSQTFYTPEQDASDRGEAPAPAKADPKVVAGAEDERKRNDERERVRKELAERRAAAERKAKEEEEKRRRDEEEAEFELEREELEKLRREQDGDGARDNGG